MFIFSGGCFWIVAGSVLLIGWLSLRRTKNDEHLISLMQEFIVGHDQSEKRVYEIHYLLMTRFAGDYRYSEVTSAAGSYKPGSGGGPMNEYSLSQAFCDFLKVRYHIHLRPTPQIFQESETEGVWPPPPRKQGW